MTTDPYRPSQVPTSRPGEDDEETTEVSRRDPRIPPSPRVPVWIRDEAGTDHLVEGILLEGAE